MANTGYECHHCEQRITYAWHCSVCGCDITNECRTCHNEVAHDIIKVPHISLLFGGTAAPRGTTDPEGDPDAFRRADYD